MVTYNIEIREFNGVDYDILHPVTTIENVEGLNNSLTQLSQNITNVSTALSNKVNKSGDTMTGNLTMERSTDPSIYFKQRDDSKGYIFLRDNQFHFNEYPADQQSYREIYSLPKTDSGLTAAKWYDILTSKNFDDTPTANSNNPVKSKGVKTALDGKVNKSGDTMTGPLTLGNNQNLRLVPSDTSKMSMAQIATRNNERLMFWHRTSDGNGNELYQLPVMNTSATGNNYYDILTSKNFDDTPTANSNNPVKSKGVKTALDGKVNTSGGTITGNLATTGSAYEIKCNSDKLLRFLNSSNQEQGALYLSNSNHRIAFRMYDNDYSNTEVYNLPSPDSLTKNKTYNILTSKNPITVEQGGTGKTKASDARHALGVQAVQQILAGNSKAYKLTGDGVNGFTFTLKRGYNTVCICFVDYWDDVRYIGMVPSWLTVVKNTSENSVIIQQTSGTVAAFVITAIGATIEEIARDESRTNKNFNNGYITTNQIIGTLPIANGGTNADNKKDALSNLGVTISNTAITEGSTLASGSIYIYYE